MEIIDKNLLKQEAKGNVIQDITYSESMCNFVIYISYRHAVDLNRVRHQSVRRRSDCRHFAIWNQRPWHC